MSLFKRTNMLHIYKIKIVTTIVAWKIYEPEINGPKVLPVVSAGNF